MLRLQESRLTGYGFAFQLEEGGTVHSDQSEDTGAAILAAHVRSLTEARSEEECQVSINCPT